ncbi:MAG: sulfatase-like hydrolase/transferase [Terrimonas sp.]|nr:sulfatase-like hydrolase/transferase [Terrimonas sp.]
MRKTICILLSLNFFVARAQPPGKQQPNIIFILTDDLGYGDIGVFFQNARKRNNDRSEPWFPTPHLDTLAARGAMLTSHYCAAPVCAPSRASLLSGLSQGQANVRDNQFDKALADQYTLGSLLQRAGYQTAAIGKWGLQGEGKGPDWPAHPLKRGFDYFFGYIRHRDGHEHYPKEGVYRDKTEVWENGKNIAAGLDKCYTGDLWTAVAKKWITGQAQKKDKPFFLYLAYDTPHAALELPTQAYPAGGGLRGGLQWLDQPGHMINTASGVPDSWMDPAFANATWDDDKNPATAEKPWPDTYKRYATIVARIDRQVGDLVQLLEDLHIANNTLLVFTSDNGPSDESYLPREYVPAKPDFFNSFGPFDGIKRDVWEGGIRVPAIAVWPGSIPAKELVSDPSVSQDWLPTIANIAGLPAPAFSDGVSFWPLLAGKKAPEKRSVYIEYFVGGKTAGYQDFAPSHRNRVRKQMQMIRIGDTAGVRYDIQTGDDDFEIYDLKNDPQQINNLAKAEQLIYLQEYFKQEVLRRRAPDTTAPRPYDDMLIPALQRSNEVHAGVRWHFFQGDFLWLPAVGDLSASASGKAPDLSSIKIPGSKQGLLYLEGYFRAPDDGRYTFDLSYEGSFLMKVYDINLFNNDEMFRNGYKKENSIFLKKGLHPFRLYFFKKQDQPLIMPELHWKGPGPGGPQVFKSWFD